MSLCNENTPDNVVSGVAADLACDEFLDDAEVIEDTVGELIPHNHLVVRAFAQSINQSALGLRIDAENVPELECVLMGVIAMVASEVRRPERILPSLRALAEAHLTDRDDNGNLQIVAEALIDAITAALGPRFTLAQELAWRRICEMLIERVAPQ